MTLGERLKILLEELPPDWSEAEVVLTVAAPEEADRAALILAPLSPGRSGPSFRIRVVASGRGGPSPDAVRRVLERLEREGIDARLATARAAEFRPRASEPEAVRSRLADRWDELVARLPDDWSDLYAEVELASSDDLERAALLLAPVNPFLHEGVRPALRFRVARRFGYGAAPSMARRVLARLDEDGISGTLRVLRVQSEVKPAHTQGLVWRESGRAV
jgi:hypothetical protein